MSAVLDSAAPMKNGGSRYHVNLPDLPASWQYKRFEDILDVQGGSQPPKSTFVYEPTPGYIQLLQIRDFGKRGVPTFVKEDSVTKRCTEDDILIARYGASLGRIVTGERGAYNVALAKVIFDRADFYNRYLFYLLQTQYFQTPIHMISRSAQNGFNKGDLSDILLPVAPLPEQRRIVGEIEKQFSRLEEGVGALQRVQANLKRYRAAVLKAACEGRLVPTEAERQRAEGRGTRGGGKYETGEELLARILAERRKNWQGRGKYKEPAAPDTSKLGKLPEGWAWASIDQLAESTLIGLDRGRAQQEGDPAGGVPYIKMNNVTMDGRVLCDEVVYVPVSREEAERFSVQDGDVLFNTRNSKELVGKVGIVRCAPGGAIFNNNLMRIRVPNRVDSAFLCMQMCSHEFRRRMELVKKATTNVAAVYQKDLLPLTIALPPFEEQSRIVAEVERRLSVVEEMEATVETNLQRATRLRQSILQKAFSGLLSK